MDWSERRLHLAAPAGRAPAVSLLEARWLQRDPHSRALWVTPQGAQYMERLAGDTVCPMAGVNFQKIRNLPLL
jgi:hypothetical protein